MPRMSINDRGAPTCDGGFCARLFRAHLSFCTSRTHILTRFGQAGAARRASSRWANSAEFADKSANFEGGFTEFKRLDPSRFATIESRILRLPKQIAATLFYGVPSGWEGNSIMRCSMNLQFRGLFEGRARAESPGCAEIGPSASVFPHHIVARRRRRSAP